MGELLQTRLRDVPQGDRRPLYFDTMEEAANRLDAVEGALEAATALLWEHCEGLAPRIEKFEAVLRARSGEHQLPKDSDR